ncbi:MAG: transcription-repair coupling factor, partial [Xanthomonadales bacterium]
MSVSPFKARFAAERGACETWSGLHGSSTALALLAAAGRFDGPTLVVTRSSHQAQLFARDLELLNTDGLAVRVFPDHETLPYDPFSPHPDIIANRLTTLAGLPAMSRGILLTPISALLQRLPPAAYITQRSFSLAAGDDLVIEAFRRRLEYAGYEAVEQVYQAGQFAVRGSVVDLFPAGSATPFRLDLFDEEIESIREFDPDSQRSTGRIDRIDLLPAREYPCDDAGLDAFRRAFRNRFDVDTRHVNLYQDLRAGVHPQGLEQYLPLF